MAYEVPALGTAGQVYTAAAHNILVEDIIVARSIQNRFATARRTAGNLVLNSTSWANVDTGLDLTLNASVGDVIEVAFSAIWSSQAVEGPLDVVTVVSAAPVSSFGSGAAVVAGTHYGVTAWFGAPGITSSVGGSAFYTLLSGDVSGGTVVLRLRYRTITAANKTIFAYAPIPMVVSAKNHGPVTT